MNPPRFVSAVEPLESRIAPATLTFIDVDGDQVVVTTSKGTDGDLAAAAVLVDSGAGKLLQKLDLASHPIFKGTDITITALNGATPSTVDIGYIDATGLDLHDVTIPGDLGQIDAGDNKLSTPAIHSLTVNSLGTLGALTQGANFSIVNDFNGAVGTLTVHGGVKGTVNVSGGAKGKIDTLVVDGDLTGNTQALGGSIFVSGAIGKATVHSLIGGMAVSTGAIEARSIGELNILGDVVGGPADHAGSVKVGTNIDQLTVAGNLLGGTSDVAKHSGEIRASKVIGTAVVHGYLKGGDGDNSGSLAAGVLIKDVTIDGGLKGGEGLESGTVGSAGMIAKATIGTGLQGGGGERSGSVLATGKLADITINGSVNGGTGFHSGTIATEGAIVNVTVNGNVIGGQGDESGAIGSRKGFGSIKITGDLEGGIGVRSGTVLSSKGIESATVNGSVLGGSGTESGAIGSNGLLKSVQIGGDLFGGPGMNSGSVVSTTRVESVKIEGSIRGYPGVPSISAAAPDGLKDGTGSGAVRSLGTIGRVEVMQDVEGGIGDGSGAIAAEVRLESAIVHGSVVGGFGNFSGVILGGRVDSVTVGGELVGSQGDESGSIQAQGSSASVLGSVKIAGDVTGGDGFRSGTIFSSGRIGDVTIGSQVVGPVFDIRGRVSTGSLLGGNGPDSGSIISEGDIGDIVIMRDIRGGDSSNTGRIFAGGNLTHVEVGNSLFGSADNFENVDKSSHGIGQIYARGRLGLAEIGNSIFGGSGSYSGAISAGSIGSLTVGRNVNAGFGNFSASITTTTGDIGSVKIEGELTTDTGDGGANATHAASIASTRNIGTLEIGNVRGSDGSEVTISAGGKLNPRSSGDALAIRSIKIGGNLIHSNILAGYIPSNSFDGTPVNPDAQIGTVTVGDPTADANFQYLVSNIVAGMTRGEDGYFGSVDDELIATTGKTSPLISRIAKVVINGSVLGRDGSALGITGIVAEQVVAVNIFATPEISNAGPHNDSYTISVDPSGSTRVQELGASPRND